ncbi:unnamed protein product [Caenorhabditis brenneri]
MSEKNSHGYPDTMLKGLADNAPYRPPGTNPEVVPSAPEPDTNAYGNPAFSTTPYRPPSINPDVLPGFYEPSSNAYSNPAFNGTQYDPPPPYPGTSMPIPAPPAPPISTQPTTYQAYPTTTIGQDTWTDADNDRMLKQCCVWCCISTLCSLVFQSPRLF